MSISPLLRAYISFIDLGDYWISNLSLSIEFWSS